jgi:trigger factor
MNLTELEMRRDMRNEAHVAVVAELLLEQIAREQELEVTEEDFGRQVALMAMQAGRDPKEVAEQLVQGGRLGAIAADIMRRKALDFVVKSINIAGAAVEEEPEETAPEAPMDPEASPTQ